MYFSSPPPWIGYWVLLVKLWVGGLLGGWGEKMIIYFVLNANKGELEKRGHFTALGGKNIILEKGGGAKISYFG